MSVTLVRQVRLRVGAGGAKPGPAIGQALGPLGVSFFIIIYSCRFNIIYITKYLCLNYGYTLYVYLKCVKNQIRIIIIILIILKIS